MEVSELVHLFSIFFLAGQFQNALVKPFQLLHGLMILDQVLLKGFLENGIVEALRFQPGQMSLRPMALLPFISLMYCRIRL